MKALTIYLGDPKQVPSSIINPVGELEEIISPCHVFITDRKTRFFKAPWVIRIKLPEKR